MARKLVAGVITVIAPLLFVAAVLISAPIAPSLLSIESASSVTNTVLAAPVPRPLSLQPALSDERALNVLPLWHGRLDEDVMANPPPPFFARAPFSRKSSTLRSASEFSSNGKIAADAGVQDSYEAMKAQYNAQEERMRRNQKSVVKSVLGLVQPASLDTPTDAPFNPASTGHLSHSTLQQIVQSAPQAPSIARVRRSGSTAPYGYRRAGFVRDTSFYKAANSRAGIAHFDAKLASDVESRRPRLAQDLLRMSHAVVRRLRPRQRAAARSAAHPAGISTRQQSAATSLAPVSSLQPLLPASLRHKLYMHDTSFYQAANSRAGIANFDARLATEIQRRRPNLSQDLKRISAAILSSPLSSLTPLLPSSSSAGKKALTATSTPSSSNQREVDAPVLSHPEQHAVQAAPTVTFHDHRHPSDYNRIFQHHSSPTAHFPQQEEAWIHFAASGASFGGETKEQREAVKKVRL
jgi:hypothetical protein